MSSPSSTKKMLSSGFLNTNNLSVIQRTVQSRKLVGKLLRINNILDAEKDRHLSAMIGIEENKSAYTRFNELLKKAQTPLQINPHIRLKRGIENVMKSQGIIVEKRPKTEIEKKRLKKKILSETDTKEGMDLQSIRKNLTQVSKISSYFDKVFKIDKKQNYLNIDTIDYWKKIDSTPQRKNLYMNLYERTHKKDPKFTFTKYQNEFDILWLEILRNLTEKDREIVFGLLNGGKIVKTEEDKQQLKEFDPLKLILKLEQKLNKQEKMDFPAPLNEKPVPSLAKTENPSNSKQKNANQKKSPETRFTLKTFYSFPRPPIQKSRNALANLLDPDGGRRNSSLLNFSKNKNISKQKPIQDLIKTGPVQECDCKHIHNLGLYEMKKKYKSILKIPSVLPPTNKTLKKIFLTLKDQKTDFQSLIEKARNSYVSGSSPKFLGLIQNQINESYITDSPIMKSEKTTFILEKYGYPKKEGSFSEFIRKKRKNIKYFNPIQEELKKCENILKKKNNLGEFKLNFLDVMKQRKHKLKHSKKKKKDFEI